MTRPSAIAPDRARRSDRLMGYRRRILSAAMTDSSRSLHCPAGGRLGGEPVDPYISDPHPVWSSAIQGTTVLAHLHMQIGDGLGLHGLGFSSCRGRDGAGPAGGSTSATAGTGTGVRGRRRYRRNRSGWCAPQIWLRGLPTAGPEPSSGIRNTCTARVPGTPSTAPMIRPPSSVRVIESTGLTSWPTATAPAAVRMPTPRRRRHGTHSGQTATRRTQEPAVGQGCR